MTSAPLEPSLAPGDAPADRPTGAPGVVAVVVVLATLAGILLWCSMLIAPWRLATGLLDAGRHLKRGQKSLTSTALKDAQYDVFAATAASRRANRGWKADSPVMDLALLHPRLEAALGETEHLVAASQYSASAAGGSLRIAKNALRGPSQIIATDSDGAEGQVIQLDRITEIGKSVGNIRSDLEGVQEELGEVELGALPRRFRPPIEDGLEAAEKAEAAIADAQAGFAILPDVLGDDEPRTYLIGMQNPAEQRGTGGAILRFALFSFDDGKADVLDTSKCREKECPEGAGVSVYDIDKNRQLLENVPLPEDAWHVRDIDDAHRFGNSNWSPDWPTSAQIMLDYAAESDRRQPGDQLPNIDGFITLDPTVMEDLIPGTGSFRLERFGNKITANRAVHFLLYKAYASYPRPGLRRAALRLVVDQFVEKLFDPQHPTELVTGMSESLATKHMMVWMKDPEEQAFIERMDWDGSIDPAKDSDYSYWVEQNVGGNKFDYYTEHTTAMDIAIEAGDAVVSNETTIYNGTFFPQPSWAMGDSGRRAPNGARRTPMHEPMMNLYVPRTAERLGAEVDGRRIDTPDPAEWTDGEPPEHEEEGKKVWSATVEIPPEEEASVRFDYRVPDVVHEDDGRSSYRLVVQHQPRVRPEMLEIHLALPDDADAIAAPEWERDGETLTWSEPLRRDMVLKVSWE